jgi:Ice-binding-like
MLRASRSAQLRTIARTTTIGFVALLAALIGTPINAMASTAPGLGTAANYAVLAGTPVISNTGATRISGSVGIAPAASVTGFPPALVANGDIEWATATVRTAKRNLTTAYGQAASSPCNFNKTGVNLGGQTLTAGTYCQTTAPTLTGTLTLSGSGVFIFQIGSTLVTAPGARVVLTNGAQACNVFWQVSSSATLDTTTTFVGTIMALTSISLNNGASISGRALAQNGAVTLINNHISVPTGCATNTPAFFTNGSGVSGVSSGSITPLTPDTGAAASGPNPGGALIAIGTTVILLTGGSAVWGRRRRDSIE